MSEEEGKGKRDQERFAKRDQKEKKKNMALVQQIFQIFSSNTILHNIFSSEALHAH